MFDNRVTGKTRTIGIIGNPIEHSISPQLHNTISNCLGIDLIYVPFKVEKENLENAMKGIKALNIVGCNVTVPYKKDVMKFLDENSKEAILMGAVNTVKNIDGRLYGYNTDAEGFSRSFKEETRTGFKDKRVVLIGAGGAARAIAVKIAIEGAQKIYIVNRTVSRAQELADMVNVNVANVAEGLSLECGDRLLELRDADIIINTTSVGMYPEINENPVGEIDIFAPGQVVYDIIYNPSETVFLKKASEKGAKTVNGLGMLFYQGISAYEIWTGFKLNEQLTGTLFEAFKKIL